MKLIILAAGVGSRLGYKMPKAMVEVDALRTILDIQIDCFASIVGIENILVVVGYKSELIKSRYSQLSYVNNSNYLTTNTAKSLLLGLEKIGNEDVVFINGDIFLTKQTAINICKCNETSFMVNFESTADEEVKYRINDKGAICELSKQVIDAHGEAVGVNFISSRDLEIVKRELRNVNDMDYFEKAFENLIIRGELLVSPLGIKDDFVKEIDFPEDLRVVKNYLKQKNR